MIRSRVSALLICILITIPLLSKADNAPVSVNLGASNFTGSSLGINVEVPLYKNLSASLGTGTMGGLSVGAKIYRDINEPSMYLGVGYGPLEFEETLSEEKGTWVEQVENGYFVVVGHRFIHESGNYLSLGSGLSYRPEETDEVNKEFKEGGNLFFSFDITYGFSI